MPVDPTVATDKEQLEKFLDAYLTQLKTWQDNNKESTRSFREGLLEMLPEEKAFHDKLQALPLTTPQGDYARCLMDKRFHKDLMDINGLLEILREDPKAFDGVTTMKDYFKKIWHGANEQFHAIDQIFHAQLTKGIEDPNASEKLKKECEIQDHPLETEKLKALLAEYQQSDFIRTSLPTSQPPTKPSQRTPC